MVRYLVAIQLPDDFEPAQHDPAVSRDIFDLNEEMIARGIRVVVGGLQTANRARTIRAASNGGVLVTDGPFVEAKEHVGASGCWNARISVKQLNGERRRQ